MASALSNLCFASKLIPKESHGNRRSTRGVVRCMAKSDQEQVGFRTMLQKTAHTAGTMALVAAIAASPVAPVLAELNKYEASTTGEFNLGTAKQYGASNMEKEDFSNQDLRRSNFTSASVKYADFTNANLQGAYFVKVVAVGTNFTPDGQQGANVSDVLFDRSVLVGANLTDAIFTRTVFTLSDFKDAIIDGADFTDALLDKPQQQALCKYAKGTNPYTGASTRKSLGCGRGRSGTPSAYMTDDKSERPEPAFDPKVFNSGNQQNSAGASNPF